MTDIDFYNSFLNFRAQCFAEENKTCLGFEVWNFVVHGNIHATTSIESIVYLFDLDAGSTGSRVLAFTFYENPITKVRKQDV